MQLFSLTTGFEFGHVTAALACPGRAARSPSRGKRIRTRKRIVIPATLAATLILRGERMKNVQLRGDAENGLF
jgi:hypothetical protein